MEKLKFMVVVLMRFCDIYVVGSIWRYDFVVYFCSVDYWYID